MKIKYTFLIAIFALLVGIQSAQAQNPVLTNSGASIKIDRSKILVDSSKLKIDSIIKSSDAKGVTGNISFPKPLDANFKDIQCSQIEVLIGDIGPGDVFTFKTVASTKAVGFVSSTKGCRYYIASPKSGETSETANHKIILNFPGIKTASCNSLFIPLTATPVSYPSAKLETVNFEAKPFCADPKK